MKNVYLIQIPFSFEYTHTVYFPYSVGLIWAYAQQFAEVTDTYQLKKFIYYKESIASTIARMENPDVVGLSCYIWNMNYTMELAKQIKIKWPSCTVIAGGPSVSAKDDNLFQNYPNIDIAIFREGEIAFTEILLAIKNSSDLYAIKGLGLNENLQCKRTLDNQRIQNLDDVPSPYLLGLFDDMFEECAQKGLVVNGLIESNRGCPYQCTFCDWGNAGLGKVKKFELTRVKKELLWMAKNKVEFITNCDANFGIFKDRDLEIAKWLVRLKKRYGYPQTFDTNWTKNNNIETVEIAKMFMDNGLLRRFSSSIQSMNQDALQAIKRKNLPQDRLNDIVDYSKKIGMQVNTEMIIGLPNETFESFQKGFVSAIEQGIYPSASPVIILTNSEMADPEYQKKYGTITKTIYTDMNYVQEPQEVVIGTSTMTPEENERLVLWCWFVTQFHFQGYTNVLYDFFRLRYNLPMEQFYNELLDQFLVDRPTEPFASLFPFIDHHKFDKTKFLTFGHINSAMHTRLADSHRLEFVQGLTDSITAMMPHKDQRLAIDLVKLQDYSLVCSHREEVEQFTLKTNLFEYIYRNEKLNCENSIYRMTNNFIPNKSSLGDYLVEQRYSKKFLTLIQPVNEVDHWDDYNPIYNSLHTGQNIIQIAK